jgi:Flp pilus assembly pilin Flp
MFRNAYLRLVAALHVAGIRFVERVNTRAPRYSTATAGYRAVTMIEYALLAGIAVILALIFRKGLTDVIDNVITGIQNATTNN